MYSRGEGSRRRVVGDLGDVQSSHLLKYISEGVALRSRACGLLLVCPVQVITSHCLLRLLPHCSQELRMCYLFLQQVIPAILSDLAAILSRSNQVIMVVNNQSPPLTIPSQKKKSQQQSSALRPLPPRHFTSILSTNPLFSLFHPTSPQLFPSQCPKTTATTTPSPPYQPPTTPCNPPSKPSSARARSSNPSSPRTKP